MLLLYQRINSLVCDLLPNLHLITLTPEPKATRKHDPSIAATLLFYETATTRRWRSQARFVCVRRLS